MVASFAACLFFVFNKDSVQDEGRIRCHALQGAIGGVLLPLYLHDCKSVGAGRL